MLKQLSVFVDNRPGSLMDVTSKLTEAHINIRAVASSDTPEFAILRLVVDDANAAKEYLTSKGFVVRVTEVIGVELEDKKGNLNHMLTILAEGEISINYIYSFVIRDGKAPVMVFHTTEVEKAIEILKSEGVKVVDEADL
jgi:hypothetical protein